ncbi:hypothetical protein ACWGJP_05765 [Microbacterium sp. NPDC055903]
MSQPAAARDLDTRALTDPVSPAALRAFAAQSSRPLPWVRILVVVVVVIGGIAALVPIIGIFVSATQTSGATLAALLPGVLIVGAAIALVTTGVLAWRRGRIRRFRLARFAIANGMEYQARMDDPVFPGMIFGRGSSRISEDLVRARSPRFVEFGNYQYTVKSGKNSTTHRWGYVAIRLDVPLPNIVLDATGNNSLFGSNLPASFRDDQRLSLEGDFDRYFRLYCPEGYARDALYLFTPDVMARFIDNAAELDVEIVDDWLFLYTRRSASTVDPATWEWMLGVVDALTVKLDQWARWRDERLPEQAVAGRASGAASPFAAPPGIVTPPGVAREGRRLRQSVNWVPIAVIAAAAVLWFGFRWF